jgi:hypothetical protein
MLKFHILSQIKTSGVISELDRAPCLYAEIIREGLNQLSPRRWNERGSKLWPPRYPDLIPLDFNLWNYVKHVLSSVKIDDTDHSKRRIRHSSRI